MNATPRVTVIIPTYNRSARLRPAVMSALVACDRPGDVEIIIVDDASPDNTPEVGARLAAEIPNVRTARQPQNAGEGPARNAGLKLARGEFVAFLDDDDIRLPFSLDRQMARLDAEKGAGFCFGPVLFADGITGELTGEEYPKYLPEGDIFWDLFERNLPQVPSVVVRRSAIPASGLFGTMRNGVADWDAWVRLAAEQRAVTVPDPVAIYTLPRPRSGQMSSNPAKMALLGPELHRAWLNSIPRAREGPAAQREHSLAAYRAWVTDWLYGHMNRALQDGDAAMARECWQSLLRVNPRFALRRRTVKLALRSLRKPGGPRTAGKP